MERERAIVLIDGRNVVRSRWPNLSDAELVERATGWAAGEGVEPVLVFDGPAPPGAIGTGRESADDWIAREAARLAGEGRRLWLVSSDRELRARVAPYVERTIGGGGFLSELER